MKLLLNDSLLNWIQSALLEDVNFEDNILDNFRDVWAKTKVSVSIKSLFLKNEN